jgi:aldehyde:ferredoxin oxidoreductase
MLILIDMSGYRHEDKNISVGESVMRMRRGIMPKGYLGKILWVNLTDHKIGIEYPEEGFYRNFIGGYGIGARFLFSRMKPKIDPLGPENILGFITGTLTGTNAIGGSRFTVVAKSPLTGGWGDANSGGFFGPQLRFAGFDAVFLAGISSYPVYLFIDNGKAEIRDANHLWGKDSHDTEDILKSELGRDVRVACIGPSGEKLSLIASVMNEKGRAAGRSGLGAVMGSKKLKALAVRGNQNIPLFDEKKVDDLRKDYLTKLGGASKYFKQSGGTVAVTLMHAAQGDTPIKNWSGIPVVDFPNPDPLAGANVLALMDKKYACYKCPVVCGGLMKEGNGEYKWKAGAHKPEYETMGMFGGSCLNNNLESIIKVNDICNRFGVDTISAGAAIAFTIECYEKGLITQQDTDGIEMKWGNHHSIVAMTEKMVRREGFGDIIADGVRVAAKKLGKGSDKYAMHIGGQEFPAHHPLVDYRFATTYRLDPTPGRHTQGGEAMHPAGLIPAYDKSLVTGRGKAHKIGSNFNHVVYSAGLCLFVYGSYPHVNVFIEFMNAVTGWNATIDEFLLTGERISNLRQAFNVREGINSVQFKIPGRLTGGPVHNEGPLAGKSIDQDILAREYLVEMDWDINTAKPAKTKLCELGLADAARELWL